MDTSKLYYMATVYRKHPGGLEWAFEDACKNAGNFIKMGYKIYSPIAHSHPIAMHDRVDARGDEPWYSLNVAMMQVCDGLLVLKMKNWEKSCGIAFEIDWFRKNRGLEPIFMEPVFDYQ